MASFPRKLDRTMSASLWWGQSLLSWYWSNLAATDSSVFTGGALTLAPRGNGTFGIGGDFFRVPGFWFRETETDQAATWSATDPADIRDHGAPETGNEVDLLAKAMYAVLLADLGQHSSDLQNNVLLGPKLLAAVSAPITELLGAAGQGSRWIQSGAADSSYDPIGDRNDVLNITDSYMYAQYLCSVPALKPGTSLFISALIADLVLLQAA
ncbi:hypothetical protein LTR70_001476 [Exophiala xenobiotica]|nr:hypothetical protein LTR70_001476 [Exophiala xenobiotica]